MTDVLKPGIHKRFSYAPHHQEDISGVTYCGSKGRSIFVCFDEGDMTIWVLSCSSCSVGAWTDSHRSATAHPNPEACLDVRHPPCLRMVLVSPRSSKSSVYLCLVESEAALLASSMPASATSTLQHAWMILSSYLMNNFACKQPSAGMGALSET